MNRNTPTGVGKTGHDNGLRLPREKHPHGRGEDFRAWLLRRSGMETPPRAWGRLATSIKQFAKFRNTPTGVGKTDCMIVGSMCPWKHPHGRGEDCIRRKNRRLVVETPPRAWGRHRMTRFTAWPARNTPTGVGKTNAEEQKPPEVEKHPHGRGEDQVVPTCAAASPETPPRAWGRPGSSLTPLYVRGNTPTGVGKTGQREEIASTSWKHPHGRGEDLQHLHRAREKIETPPRAWGRHVSSFVSFWKSGNTPTGVGKTFCRGSENIVIWKHPHGRGEDSVLVSAALLVPETPPRAWGRPRATLIL